jgi:hypothetical protein
LQCTWKQNKEAVLAVLARLRLGLALLGAEGGGGRSEDSGPISEEEEEEVGLLGAGSWGAGGQDVEAEGGAANTIAGLLTNLDICEGTHALHYNHFHASSQEADSQILHLCRLTSVACMWHCHLCNTSAYLPQDTQ